MWSHLSKHVCVDAFESFSFSQLGTVLLQQLETELAEDLEESHIWVLLFSLLWIPKCKTYTVPKNKHKTHNSPDIKTRPMTQKL